MTFAGGLAAHVFLLPTHVGLAEACSRPRRPAAGPRAPVALARNSRLVTARPSQPAPGALAAPFAVERGACLDMLVARLKRRETSDPACAPWVGQLRAAILQLGQASQAPADGGDMDAATRAQRARHVERLRDILLRKLQRAAEAAEVADADLVGPLQAARCALRIEGASGRRSARRFVHRPPAMESALNVWQADDDWLFHAGGQRLSSGMQRWAEQLGDALCRLQAAEADLQRAREEFLLAPQLTRAWLQSCDVHVEVREAIEPAQKAVRQALDELDMRLASFNSAALLPHMPRDAWVERVSLMRQHVALRRADVDGTLRPVSEGAPAHAERSAA